MSDQLEMVKCPNCPAPTGRQAPLYDRVGDDSPAATGEFRCEACGTTYNPGETMMITRALGGCLADVRYAVKRPSEYHEYERPEGYPEQTACVVCGFSSDHPWHDRRKS